MSLLPPTKLDAVFAMVGISDHLAFASRTALVGSPASETFAWVEKVRGVENVWAATAPAWTPSKLTAFDQDGLALTGLSFVGPKADAIAFVRSAEAGSNVRSLVGGTPPPTRVGRWA